LGRVWRNRNLLIGGSLAFLIAATAILSLFYTPYDPNRMNMNERFFSPSAAHWLGTDQYGRDILSRIMKGAVNSLVVGWVAVGIGLSIGVLLGSLAAYWRGWWDEGIMRLADVFYGFPAVLSAILITSVLGPGMGNSMLAIGIFYIPIFARLTRGTSLSIWKRDYVTSARAIGQSNGAMAEAALSYLGLGTQPPHASWGRMLNEAQTFMEISPGLAIFPGLAIAAAVLGFNLLGDGLRDLLDPRLARQKHSGG
jgi:peptide/nickel transport system permease protein